MHEHENRHSNNNPVPARIIALAREFQPQGIGFVAINPNDPEIQKGDDFDSMVKLAAKKRFPYPYLVDTTQEIARAYGASVTPHVFLLDGDGVLVYRGRIDNALRVEEVKDRDLARALEALVSGSPVPVTETKAFGCSIKWARQ